MEIDLRKTLLLTFAIYLFSLSFTQFYILAKTSSLLPKPFAIVSSGPANVSLTITNDVAIEFTVNSIDFGFGFVNESCNNCTMDVQGNGTAIPICCGSGWANPPQDGLLLENTGNVAVSLFMNITSNASEWIGGTNISPSFQFQMIPESSESHDSADGDDTSDSCASGWSPSSWTEATTDGLYACGSATDFDFTSADWKDEVHVVVRVVVPDDASKGQKQVTFVATATGPS